MSSKYSHGIETKQIQERYTLKQSQKRDGFEWEFADLLAVEICET